MKTLKNWLAVALLSLTGTLAATAQSIDSDREETRKYPYAFVGVQGGAQAVLNGYKFTDVVTPVGAVNVGGWFSPALGARLQVNGWKSKEGVKGFGTYDFTYGAAGVDAMVNLVNAFSKTDDHVFNVILLGGIGFNKAWQTNYKGLTNAEGDNYYWNGNPATSKTELGSRVHNHVAFQTRIGVLFDVNVADNWSLSLEGDFNHVGSRGYAHAFNGAKDWQFVGLLGVTYKFGKKSKKAKVAEVVPATVVQPQPEPQPEAKPEPKPEVKPEPRPEVKKEQVKKEVFFVISSSRASESEARKVAEAAEWLKAHPTATATVKGYADKGTGTSAINERLARQRAAHVADLLVKKHGIDASRLTVGSYGDTMQPFAENDKNRVVIVEAKEK